MSRKRPQPPVKPFKKKPNPLKAAKVTEIDYKDVALLRKFISDRGKIRSRRITGVTVQEQREIAKAIKNAREMVSAAVRDHRPLSSEEETKWLSPRLFSRSPSPIWATQATSSRSRTATPATT